MNLTGWDVLLIVVTAQSLVLAYTEAPRWKRLLLSLPFPFTLVVLSVGRPIDGSSFASPRNPASHGASPERKAPGLTCPSRYFLS